MESEGKKKRKGMTTTVYLTAGYFLHHIGWRVLLLPALPPTDSAQDRRMLSEHTQAGSSSFSSSFFFFSFSFPFFFSLSPLPAAAAMLARIEEQRSRVVRGRARRHPEDTIEFLSRAFFTLKPPAAVS